MAPKKKEEEKKVLLGRPGNSLKSGIVRWCIPFNLRWAQRELLTLFLGWPG